MDYNKAVDHLKTTKPDTWEEMPRIKLIISQLMEIMEEQHLGSQIFDDEKYKTSMVNYFAKKGIIPRAEGKKYGKEHIASNTITALLKQVLSMEEMKPIMISGAGDGETLEEDKIKEFYERLTLGLERELAEVMPALEALRKEESKKTFPMDKKLSEDKKIAAETALDLAIKSYVNRLACRIIIEGLL